MKHVAVYSLLFLLLVLTACPAKMDYPVDTGSYNVPGWLLGKWSSASGPTLSKEVYIFEKGAKKTEFKCYSVDSAGQKTLAYDPVYMSKVGDIFYLSAYSDAGFYIFKFQQKSNSSFSIAELDEDFVTASEQIRTTSNSAEIVKFLKANKDEEAFSTMSDYIKIN